tara:strand:- start:1054 stop:1452 length:399 start_codon:yes stop_codon:yes gene_type:complete
MVRIGFRNFKLDPKFNPEDWEEDMIRLDPQSKMAVTDLRETMDITFNPKDMGELLTKMQNEPLELRERFMRIEAEAEGFESDGKGGYTDNGKKMTPAQEKRFQRKIDRLMVLRNPHLSDFPSYIQKVLRERA